MHAVADGSELLRRNALIMVWDGLRPDMVSEDLTPRLHALAGAGTWFERSHAVVGSLPQQREERLAVAGRG
jgi:hypothetical protein